MFGVTASTRSPRADPALGERRGGAADPLARLGVGERLVLVAQPRLVGHLGRRRPRTAPGSSSAVNEPRIRRARSRPTFARCRGSSPPTPHDPQEGERHATQQDAAGGARRRHRRLRRAVGACTGTALTPSDCVTSGPVGQPYRNGVNCRTVAGRRRHAPLRRLRPAASSRDRAAAARRAHVPRQLGRRASSSCASPAGASRPTRPAWSRSSRPGCATACSTPAAGSRSGTTSTSRATSTSPSGRPATRRTRRCPPTTSASSTRSWATSGGGCRSTRGASTPPASPTARASRRAWRSTARRRWPPRRSPGGSLSSPAAEAPARPVPTYLTAGTLDDRILAQTGPPPLAELPLNPFALLREPVVASTVAAQLDTLGLDRGLFGVLADAALDRVPLAGDRSGPGGGCSASAMLAGCATVPERGQQPGRLRGRAGVLGVLPRPPAAAWE